VKASMASSEGWANLGGAENDKGVTEGVIEVPKDAAAAKRRVLVVRRAGKDENEAPFPSAQLVVKKTDESFPLLSYADAGRLRAGPGATLKFRALTGVEAAKRIATRLTLPVFALFAAVAAIVAAIFSDLRDPLSIATACLAAPAALIVLVRALKEP
jgi:hypothetical protein